MTEVIKQSRSNLKTSIFPRTFSSKCIFSRQQLYVMQTEQSVAKWIPDINFCDANMPWIIFNRGEWLRIQANIKGASKDAKIYVGRSTTVHNLLFCVHTLCISYVIKTFLSVSSSVSSKQLLYFVHGQGQKREQKHTTKNFVEFHNHSPLLTMHG